MPIAVWSHEGRLAAAWTSVFKPKARGVLGRQQERHGPGFQQGQA
jgi:hypothetical protein